MRTFVQVQASPSSPSRECEGELQLKLELRLPWRAETLTLIEQAQPDSANQAFADSEDGADRPSSVELSALPGSPAVVCGPPGWQCHEGCAPPHIDPVEPHARTGHDARP